MPDPAYLSPAEMERLANRYGFERDKQEGRRARAEVRHGTESRMTGALDKKLASLFARQSKGKLRRQQR